MRKWLCPVALVLLAWAAAAAWQAHRERQVDLGRELVGRWIAEGWGGPSVACAPMQTTGEVARVTGDRGTALEFGISAGRATVPDSPGLAAASAENFSLMAWIQPQPAETSFGVMSILEKRKVGGILNARGYSLHLEYGHLACQLSPAAGFHPTRADFLSPKRLSAAWQDRHAPAPANRFISTGPNLFDGAFHHVALTLDRRSESGGKLYVDGRVVLVFDPTKLRGSLANTEPLLIGTHPDSTLHCGFHGRIGDARIYARCLSGAEIAAAAGAGNVTIR